jgi:uncharacterized protein
MRRSDRRIAEADAWRILEEGGHGVLSTVSPDRLPYGVPLSYCVLGGAIYVHCAREGRKLEHLAHDPRVSFCVVGRTEVLPDEFSTLYESCIVEGVAAEAFGAQKQAALEGLVAKYSPGFEEEGLGYIAALSEETRVFRIEVAALAGKARRR